MIKFIDIDTGTITIDKITFFPKEFYQDIVAKVDLQYWREEQTNNFKKLFNSKVHIQDSIFGCRLSFNIKSELVSIIIFEFDSRNTNWAYWSKESEHERFRQHNEFLFNQIVGKFSIINHGIRYQFNWGVIESTYVAQSASSSISITYF